MFGGFGLTELLVVLAIVLLIFGPKRLKSLGSDLGSAIKGFRTAVSDEEKAKEEEDARVIEGETRQAHNHKAESKQDTNV
ncbi:MAG: twin-arginine translocase TatA/TatE family subunit [Pseudomonadales bacterium]